MRESLRLLLIPLNEEKCREDLFRDISLMLEIKRKVDSGVTLDRDFYSGFLSPDFISNPLTDEEEKEMAEALLHSFSRHFSILSAIHAIGNFKPSLVLESFVSKINSTEIANAQIIQQIIFTLDKLLAVGIEGRFSSEVNGIIKTGILNEVVKKFQKNEIPDWLVEDVQKLKWKIESRVW